MIEAYFVDGRDVLPKNITPQRGIQLSISEVVGLVEIRSHVRELRKHLP